MARHVTVVVNMWDFIRMRKLIASDGGDNGNKIEIESKCAQLLVDVVTRIVRRLWYRMPFHFLPKASLYLVSVDHLGCRNYEN